MIYTTTIQIGRNNKFYDYFDEIAHSANNLYNAILFRERQLFFSKGKLKQEMSDNERLVRAEAGRYTEQTGYEVPGSGFAGYEFLCGMTALNHNQDRYAECLSAQTAESVIKEACQKFKDFFASCQAYKENPSAFLGQPRPPRYLTKGGTHAFTISNQDAVIRTNKKGHTELKLPLIKKAMSLGNIKLPQNMKFSQVQVSPHNGRYQIALVFNDGIEEIPVSEVSERIIGIDLGVDNVMAVVNNFGAECMIFNGHILKAYNQHANKRMSKIVSSQTKGTTNKFVPTGAYYKVLNKRENSIKDYILKASKMLIDWCTEQCVDTVVIGHSMFWKDKCPFKDKETQNFVQIPFDSLIRAIRYRCERAGIRLVVKEESYTSKASFLDGDFIPVYNKKLTKEEHKLIDKTFSGYRPHRGIYVSKDGTRINADLNGAANILRKAFPDAFEKGIMPDFRNMRYIIHPDYENRKVNQEKQRKAQEAQNNLDFKTLMYFHQR